MSGTMRMQAPTPPRVNAVPAGAESRERSTKDGTVQPETPSRISLATTPATSPTYSTTEPTPDLRAAVHEVLRCAFLGVRNGGSTPTLDDDTCGAVRSMCAMARATDTRAETLILAIKGGWRQLPEAHGTTRMDAEVTLAALITMCIKEYYAPQRSL